MSKENQRYQEGTIRSLLARPNELTSVIEILDPGDFEDVNYKVIYEAMVELLLEKKEISLPEIALKIGESGGSIDTAWFFNLEQNISAWVQAAPPTTWAKLLKKESARTKAKNVLMEGISNVNDSKSNPLEVMDSVSSALTKVALETSTEEKFDIKDSVANFRQETEDIQKSGGKIAAISSAYPSIDYYTQGWAPTHLITVGARTGIGKSVFAINNLVTALVQGKTVLFFSLEMSEREVLSRIIASIAMIPIQKIEKAVPLTQEEKEKVNEALDFIENSNLIIDTNPYVTIQYLKRKSIKQAQSEEGLDFIIIDYLQLIQNEGKKSRQEAVAEVSRSVKILAKELNVPVMVLVQLNREKKDDSGETDNMPKLYDIRESGAIAQDSNVVILIHRDMEQDAEKIDPKAVFILAKNRQGEANKFITVRTRLECSQFIDDSKRAEDEMMKLEQSIEENGDYEQFNTGDSSNPFGSSNEEPINFNELGDSGESLDYFKEETPNNSEEAFNFNADSETQEDFGFNADSEVGENLDFNANNGNDEKFNFNAGSETNVEENNSFDFNPEIESYHNSDTLDDVDLFDFDGGFMQDPDEEF